MWVHKVTSSKNAVGLEIYRADIQDNEAYFTRCKKPTEHMCQRDKGAPLFARGCAVRKASLLRISAQEPVSLTAIHYHLKCGGSWMKPGPWHSSASHSQLWLAHTALPSRPIRRMMTWKSGNICFHLGYMISRGLIWTNLPVQPQTLLLVWDL